MPEMRKLVVYMKHLVKYNLTRTKSGSALLPPFTLLCQGHVDLQLGLELGDMMNLKYESLQLKLKNCFDIFLSTVKWSHTEQLITQILTLFQY